MGKVKIVVQPPERTQAETCLWPPVIAKQTVQASDPSINYFATITVVDRHGSVVDGLLAGTKAASRYQVPTSKPGRESYVFAFPDLSISRPGTYVLRVDVYEFLGGDYAGATLLEQLETRAVSVSSSPVTPENPSIDEHSLIRKVRDAGVPICQSP